MVYDMCFFYVNGFKDSLLGLAYSICKILKYNLDLLENLSAQ